MRYLYLVFASIPTAAMGILGCSTSAPPLIHFAPKTAQIPLKKSNTQEESSDSLRNLVQDKCPSLFTPFEPTWWLNKYAFLILLWDPGLNNLCKAAIYRQRILFSRISRRWTASGIGGTSRSNFLLLYPYPCRFNQAESPACRRWYIVRSIHSCIQNLQLIGAEDLTLRP